MHRGSSATPSAAPVAVVSQPITPDPPAPTSVPISSAKAQPAEEEALPLTPAISPAMSVTREIEAVSAPLAAPAIRHQANKVEAKRPIHVDVKRPDSSPQRPQLTHDLKMSAPTVESRSGRLVDGSVPDMQDATSRVNATLGGALISTVSHTDNPPEPPVLFASAGSSSKTAIEPKLISSTRPVYPPQAKQANVEGDVLVVAEIDLNGKVIAAKATAGPVFLRQAAVDAVRNWKYEPATMDGRLTSMKITVKFQFRLK